MNRKELILKIKEVLNFDDLEYSSEENGKFLINKQDMEREEVIFIISTMYKELYEKAPEGTKFQLMRVSPTTFLFTGFEILEDWKMEQSLIPQDFLLKVVIECYENDEFVREYNRLTGSSLKQAKLPIELMIDDATGFKNAELEKFADFVIEYVVRTCF